MRRGILGQRGGLSGHRIGPEVVRVERLGRRWSSLRIEREKSINEIESVARHCLEQVAKFTAVGALGGHAGGLHGDVPRHALHCRPALSRR